MEYVWQTLISKEVDRAISFHFSFISGHLGETALHWGYVCRVDLEQRVVENV